VDSRLGYEHEGRSILVSTNSNAYLWPGTQATSGTFPDTGIPAAYYRIQQPAIISGMSAGLNVAPGTTRTVTLLVRVTPSGGTIADTIYTVTFQPTDLFQNFYSGSVNVNTGDRIHLYITYTGGNANLASDLTVQLDLY
jgi:hypothetical protein